VCSRGREVEIGKSGREVENKMREVENYEEHFLG
jgi:hypothetical protein